MDFFQAQERARSATRWLVLWFALCVIGVIATLYAVAVWAKPFLVPAAEAGAGRLWDPQLLAIVAPTIGGIMVLGSLFKLAQLSSGGSVVARDLGGRAVDPSTSEPLERRLLNVVEEMAIASGIAAPEVWVLDHEEGINAFAAGTDPSNAVIGVTRGCLERLNRAELQGVIAHEFSHILNGDMRLNMRLLGWIFGLVMIAMLGRMVLEMLRYTRTSRDSKNAAGVLVAMILLGASLWAVGAIGGFFARLLQAGVSRQREYLADASAVQFTRNPSGLADALKKVGGYAGHGRLETSKASEARHLFFAASDLIGMGLATHPPLEERIRAIDPAWDGKMKQAERQEGFAERSASTPSEGRVPPRLTPATSSFALETLGESARLDRKVGGTIHRQLQQSHAVFHSKEEAKSLLYGLLLAQEDGSVQSSLKLLAERTSQETGARADAWHRALRDKTAAEKLALVDLSLPWLRRMSREEAERFLGITRALIAADGQVNWFEFLMQKVIERHVAVGLGLRPVARIRFQSLQELGRETAVLLGAFSAISQDQAALDQAAREYREHTGEELLRLPPGECSLQAVAAALQAIESATPLVKVRILRLCGLTAMHDGVLEDAEVELLRAAADAIGAPVPPLSRMEE